MIVKDSQLLPQLHVVKVGTTLMREVTRGQRVGWIPGRIDQPGRILVGSSSGKAKESLPTIPHDQPRASSRINDSYCVDRLQERLLAGSQVSPHKQTMNIFLKYHVVKVVPTAPGHSQKREISPGSADCHFQKENKLNYVKSVSCVTQLCCVKPVTNVKTATSNLPVGARLQNYWQTWLDLGAGSKVVQILREGYTLPFLNRPKLTWSSTVISCYVNSHRNLYLLEALHQLFRQKRSRASTKSKISGLFQPTIFSSKTQQQM